MTNPEQIQITADELPEVKRFLGKLRATNSLSQPIAADIAERLRAIELLLSQLLQRIDRE